MFKKKLVILMLIPFTLMGCKKKDDKTRESDEPVDVDPSLTVDDIEEKDYKKIPSYIAAKLGSYSSYKSVTSGETVSSGLIKVTQSIDVTCIKSEFSYTKNESHSSIVNTVHEAYYHDSKAVYRDKDSGDYSVSSLESYLSTYGSYPFDNSIEGYSLKEDAIKSVVKEETQNNNIVFKAVFDEDKSTNNVKIQMKKFGGLDDYPSFSLIEMTFEIDNDFTLHKISLHSKYKAKKVLNTDCEQSYVVTFTNYNENIDVPNLDSVRNLFN